MDTDKFPKLEIMPIVDRVVDTALWVGRLLTRQFQHEVPSEHFSAEIPERPKFPHERL